MSPDQYAVNSLEYWDQRFSVNWGEAGGPAQTRFFADIALRLMPASIRADISRFCKTLADIGCAEGEAAAVMKETFPSLQVVGFDFSERAIEIARARYPEVEFQAHSLESITEQYDVVMCSNVLEHFGTPGPIVEKLAKIAKRHLLILVPGWEVERHPEHEVTFRLGDFPRTLEGLHLAHVAALNCARIDPQQWPGYQLLLIYSDASAIAASNTTVGDLVAAAQLPDLSTDDFADLRGKDGHLRRLCEFAEQQQASSGLLHAVMERLETLGERQEAIGYAGRQELLGAFNALQNEIIDQSQAAARLQSTDLERALGEASDLRLERVSLLEQLVRVTSDRDAERCRADSAHEQLDRMALQAAGRDHDLKHLQCSVDEQDQIIKNLSDEIMGSKLKEQHLESSVEQRDQVIERMTSDHVQKDERIRSLERYIDQLRSEVGNLNSTLQLAIESHRWRESYDAAMLDAWCRHAAALDDDRGRLGLVALTMQQQVRELRASTSWKLSAPLRWISHGILGRAPAPALPTLEGPRSLVFSLPGVAATQPSQGDAASVPSIARAPASRDLLWNEFQQRVLSKRDLYRGIFVQEVVIDWNVPLYQRPQHIAAAMGRAGYLVIYRTVNWTNDDVQGFREVAPNVWLTNSVEVDDLNNAARSLYSTAYADDPSNLQRRPADSLMTYEYIDHIDPQISGDSENIARLLRLKEWAFGGGARLVVASARVLEAEAIAAVGPDRVVLVPNGVDTRHYRNPAHARTVLPEALLEFRQRHSSVVGYFGAIAPWLWYDAINELVAARPDIGFVFIGPDYYGGTERLPRGDNVLYLGAVDYGVLPAHARLFDICFIPFEPGEIARTTSPLKLFEYFALEKPVVVTADMVECVAHREVFCGGSVAELSSAIDAAFAVKDCGEHRARLRQLADENDWDRRAETLAHAIERLHSAH